VAPIVQPPIILPDTGDGDGGPGSAGPMFLGLGAAALATIAAGLRLRRITRR
jgi:hypothetical protein